MPIRKSNVLAALIGRRALRHEERVVEDVVCTRRSWEAQAQEMCSSTDLRAGWYEQTASEYWELAQERAAELQEARLHCVGILRRSEEDHSFLMAQSL